MCVCVCVCGEMCRSENTTVTKRLQLVIAETDRDVVHCPTVGNKLWMFDQRLADVVNQFASKNGRAIMFCTNLFITSSCR